MPDKYSVTLAPVTGDDYALLAQWVSANAGFYASGTKHQVSADEFREFLDRADDKYLMVCTTDGEPVGAVSWKPAGAPGNYAVGTMIGDPDMWGAGFGAEATILLVGILFDSMNAHRVEFTCGLYNRRSVESLCSGMITIEGVLRDYYFLDGAYHHALTGSILRAEYYARRAPAEIVPAQDKEAAWEIAADFLEKNPVVLRSSPGAAPTATERKRT